MDFLRVITKTTLLATVALVSNIVFGVAWAYWEFDYSSSAYQSFGVLVMFYNIDTVINCICIILCFSFAIPYYRIFCECKCYSSNENDNGNTDDSGVPCSPHGCCLKLFDRLATEMTLTSIRQYSSDPYNEKNGITDHPYMQLGENNR